MLNLLLGRAGSGKTTAVLRRIGESGGARPQVLVVPEQHSHDMERHLCAIGGNQVSRYAEVLSFTRMAGRVFTVTGGLAAPTLDAGGRLLLMYAALQAVAGELKVYGRPSRKPEFLSGLIATVDELKSCCVTPGHLWTAGEVDDEPVLMAEGGYRRLAEYLTKERTDGIIIPIGRRPWSCSRSLSGQLPPPERWRDESGAIDIPDRVLWARRNQRENDFGAYNYASYIVPKGT